MMLAPGDRVQANDRCSYFDGGVYPGRVGHVIRRTTAGIVVQWEDDRLATIVDAAHLVVEPPEHCPLCDRDVYLATGAGTGQLAEFVPDTDGPLALVGGVGIANDLLPADRQAKERRYLSADMAIQRVTMHWRVCLPVAKYRR